MSVPLDGSGLTEILKQDSAAYNALFPRFNANIDWAGEKCIAKPADLSKPPQ